MISLSRGFENQKAQNRVTTIYYLKCSIFNNNEIMRHAKKEDSMTNLGEMKR